MVLLFAGGRPGPRPEQCLVRQPGPQWQEDTFLRPATEEGAIPAGSCLAGADSDERFGVSSGPVCEALPGLITTGDDDGDAMPGATALSLATAATTLSSGNDTSS